MRIDRTDTGQFKYLSRKGMIKKLVETSDSSWLSNWYSTSREHLRRKIIFNETVKLYTTARKPVR